MAIFEKITEENKSKIIASPAFTYIGSATKKGYTECFEEFTKNHKTGIIVLYKNQYDIFKNNVDSFNNFDYIIKCQ